MLAFVFGPIRSSEVHFRDQKTAAGRIELERAEVRWFLSIEPEFLPENAIKGEKVTYRSITIEGEELEFSGGFNDLHTESYQMALDGKGFGVEENRSAIKIVEDIRTQAIEACPKSCHPLLSRFKK